MCWPIPSAVTKRLWALYFAKQQFNGFLVMKSLKRKRAQKMMPQFLALIEQFEQSPARALAETLRSWLEPIVRMWRFTKSNGITEGFHTKIGKSLIFMVPETGIEPVRSKIEGF